MKAENNEPNDISDIISLFSAAFGGLVAQLHVNGVIDGRAVAATLKPLPGIPSPNVYTVAWMLREATVRCIDQAERVPSSFTLIDGDKDN